MSDERRRILDRGREHIEDGRHAEAIALLERWLADSGDDAAAWSLLSAALSRADDWRGAEEAARRVVKLKRGSARAWTNWAITLRKLERRDEARRALRQALRRDPGYDRARREMHKLQAQEEEQKQAREQEETSRCPKCGEPVFPSDTVCLECGADLLAAQREAEERARAEAVAKHAELLREGRGMVEQFRSQGLSEEEIYARLERSGWEEEDLRSILELDASVRIISLPEGRRAFVDGVERARQLRDEALERVGELRERRKEINREIGELRSSSRAQEIAARSGRDEGVPPDAADLTRREALAALEETRREVEQRIHAWEEAATALDAWTGRFY